MVIVFSRRFSCSVKLMDFKKNVLDRPILVALHFQDPKGTREVILKNGICIFWETILKSCSLCVASITQSEVNPYSAGIEFSRQNLTSVDVDEQAQRTMFSLLRRSRQLDLPLDIQLELFDTLITPILTYWYGCKVCVSKI